MKFPEDKTWDLTAISWSPPGHCCVVSWRNSAGCIALKRWILRVKLESSSKTTSCDVHGSRQGASCVEIVCIWATSETVNSKQSREVRKKCVTSGHTAVDIVPSSMPMDRLCVIKYEHKDQRKTQCRTVVHSAFSQTKRR